MSPEAASPLPPAGGQGPRLPADPGRPGRAEEGPRLAALRPARPASGLAEPVPRRPLGTAARFAWKRLPLLALGFIALFAGVGDGLARLGWPMPDIAAGAAALHGPLMVCGFFGVVISLERAVAIGRAWALAAPLAAGLGSAALLHGVSGAAWLYAAASAVLVAASLRVLARQREGFMLVIALGAACWGIGTGLWAVGAPVYRIVGWWIGFLVLTIAGERLELSRFLPPSPAARRLFGLIVAAMLAALAAWPWWPVAANVFGATLLALAAWLLRQDIARRTVTQRDLTRFIAVCLLSGYFWLAIGGAVIAAAGLEPGGRAYDAALHALLLGFVFSMVFGHAPIIFPAVLRVAVPYRPWFYAPLVLLHASLALRLAGDAVGRLEIARWGALLSALALLAFVVGTASAVLQGRRAGAGAAT